MKLVDWIVCSIAMMISRMCKYSSYILWPGILKLRCSGTFHVYKKTSRHLLPSTGGTTEHRLPHPDLSEARSPSVQNTPRECFKGILEFQLK